MDIGNIIWWVAAIVGAISAIRIVSGLIIWNFVMTPLQQSLYDFSLSREYIALTLSAIVLLAG